MKRPWKIGLLLSLAVFGAVLFNLLISPPMAKAVNPTTLSFQGKVVNANGTNVTDGTYSFLFKLYTVSSAGTAVWSETQASTTVTAGTFQVNLGSVCPFFTANACNNSTPIDFNANPNLYLGITFNGDAAGEMSPRVQLQSVPYAFNSDKVGGFTAAQLVQLSPGSPQTGFINVSGAGTFGNSLTVSAGSVTIGAFTSAGVVHSSSAGLLSDSAVILGTETSGNYVATLGTLTGLTTTGNTGAGSTPTLSVTYGSSASMAVQGNVTLTCPSGSGNLTGGGTAITLGAGGTCAAISTNAAVSFGTSVTTPLVTSSAGLAITGGTTLTLSSTSGTLAVNSAGALNLTGAAASTLNTGANTLAVTSSNFNVTATGIVTLAGAQTADITTAAGTAPTALVFQPGNNTTATSTGAAFTLQAGNDSGATAATGGLLTLRGGNATGGSQIGGGVTIDSGTGTTGGTLSVGTANAASLSLGRAGITTTNNGALTVTQALTANGSVSVAANQSVTLQSGTGVFTQSFSNSVASSAHVFNLTNTNAGAGITMQGINITPSNVIGASSGTNLLNIINFAAGGALLASDNTNGINFASATGYTNFIKTPTFNLSSAGAITGVTTIDATGYKINGTAGVTVAACGGTQALNGITVTGGIITAGNCANNLTDIAEQYNSFENLEPGDVVAPDTTYPYVKKTNTSYQANAMGIVSTAPNQVLGGGNPGYPIALIGRVPAKVNLENGPIYPGDYVTSSSQPGYAMKFSGSGQTIGIALEAYDGSQPNLKINVFVNLGHQQSSQAGSIITPQLISSGALVINSGSAAAVSIDSGDNSGSVKIGATNAQSIDIARPGATTTVKGALVADGPSDFRGSVTMHFNTPTTAFKIDNSGINGAVDAAIQITDSAGTGYTKLISTPNFGVTGNGDISTNGSIISKGGAFQLLDPAGQLLISFDQAGNGNLKGNLNLSSASLSGGLSVGGDANFAGLSTFQKLATFLGKTIFRQDVQFDGHITVASDTAGYAMLRSGESSVHITFKSPYEVVPIVNANIINGQFGNAGVNNITATGFDISLPAPATGAMTLSWTALAVTNPQTTANPVSAPTPTPITATTAQSPNSGPVTAPTTTP